MVRGNNDSAFRKGTRARRAPSNRTVIYAAKLPRPFMGSRRDFAR
jgi:hypothetical protein